MIEASCHCGSIKLAIPRQPDAVTNCNCSVCRRYGALWAYFDPTEIRIQAEPGALQGDKTGVASIAFIRCARCGCVTHWSPVAGRRKSNRMGVNVRMFNPDALGPFKIRFLDGAGTEEFVGEWSPVESVAQALGQGGVHRQDTAPASP